MQCDYIHWSNVSCDASNEILLYSGAVAFQITGEPYKWGTSHAFQHIFNVATNTIVLKKSDNIIYVSLKVNYTEVIHDYYQWCKIKTFWNHF